MISFSKLLLGQGYYGDSLRYDPKAQGQARGALAGSGRSSSGTVRGNAT